MESPPALEVSEVSHWFGRQLVLDDISFRIEERRILCLLGPSGCGKSTLLRIIAGLISPRAGEIKINGTDQRGVPTSRRNLGFIFQTPLALFPHMSVFENVAFPFKHLRRKNRLPGWRNEVTQILETVQLDAFSHRPITNLSGGELQRLALARAVVHRPKILLLDEPVSALDHHLRTEMLSLIKRVQTMYACSAVCVTHDIEDAMALADDIAVMGDGIILQKGTLESVLRNPGCKSVANILGRWNSMPPALFTSPDHNERGAGDVAFPSHSVRVFTDANISTAEQTCFRGNAIICASRPLVSGWHYELEIINPARTGCYLTAQGATSLPIGTEVTVEVPLDDVIPIQPS